LDISDKKCWDLVESKKCTVGQQMSLSLDPDFKDQYGWYQDVVATNKKYSFRKIEMNSNEESSLFGIENCNPRTGFCKTSDSIIVWDTSKCFIHAHSR